MKLVSLTLAGPGTAPIIGDALRSVATTVDSSLIIWTAHDPEMPAPFMDALDAAEQTIESVRWWPWRDDFAAARNHAIDRCASVCGVAQDWAVMLDTDERAICLDPAALRTWLAALPDTVQVVLVRHHDNSHTRERLFRLPARYKFQGRTHEMYPCPATEQAIAPAELIQWTELPKTREQLKAKFARDVAMLREDLRTCTCSLHLSEHTRGAMCPPSSNGAALYYLGISLQSLALYAREDGDEDGARGGFEAALESYRRHREIDTRGAAAWHEGTAFSCYRAAECYLALGQPDRAIDCAAAGMVLDAGIAELPWIAAVASLQVGRLEQARCWAELAKTHAMGSEAERRRVGFRLPRGLTTGPDEVLEAVRAQLAPDAPCSWVGIRQEGT